MIQFNYEVKNGLVIVIVYNCVIAVTVDAFNGTFKYSL